MIEIKGLKVRFGEQEVLRGIDWFIPPKSRVGLVGGNGAGKTTLLRVLAGEADYEGSISMPKGHAVGYLPQDFGLFDELTVTQFLDYMAALKGISNPKAAIQKTIQAVNLEEKAKSKIRTLSGGQRQRVGIAQALLGNPPFLIFDEPTVGLDPEERIHFRNLFSRTAEDRLVLLSTHIKRRNS